MKRGRGSSETGHHPVIEGGQDQAFFSAFGCSKVYQRLYEQVQQHVFACSAHKDLLLERLFGGSNAWLQRTSRPWQGSPSAWPVMWLKESRLRPLIWGPASDAQIFTSSGTSFAPTVGTYPLTLHQSSVSAFSRDGLFMYKMAAVHHFVQQLQKTSHGVDDFVGISLIPGPTEWQHSSLATMLSWFGEYFPMEYVKDLGSLRRRLLARTVSDGPVWIFGTAAHFLEEREGEACEYVGAKVGEYWRHVYVFETGGIKTAEQDRLTAEDKRRSIYRGIQRRLQVPWTHIGSEYSSCELAAQAYAFDPQRQDEALPGYVFPGYVYWAPWTGKTSVEVSCVSSICDGERRTECGDEGQLVLYDPLRIDLPVILCTEDMVVEVVSGSERAFLIMGRLIHAPARGCSLRVRHQAFASERWSQVRATDAVVHLSQQLVPAYKEGRAYVEELRRWSASRELRVALTAEFDDGAIGEWAQRDLWASLPWDQERVWAALHRSEAEAFVGSEGRVVLFIVPNNHSLACLYPLYLMALQLRIVGGGGCGALWVRVPQSFRHKDSVLMQFLQWLHRMMGTDITVLPSSFRLGSGQAPGPARVFAYGSHTTMRALQQQTERLAGGGEATAVVALMDPTPELLQAAYKDFVSLGGRGCMSARMLFLPASAYTLFRTMVQRFPPVQMAAEALSLLHKRECLWRVHHQSYLQGARVPGYAHGPLYPFSITSSQQPRWPFHFASVEEMSQMLRDAALFVLPVVFYHDLQTLRSMLACTSITYVSSDQPRTVDAQPWQQVRRVGELNIQSWDGTFESKPLFARYEAAEDPGSQQ